MKDNCSIGGIGKSDQKKWSNTAIMMARSTISKESTGYVVCVGWCLCLAYKDNKQKS